jgi:DNA-binding GntR family transcriptional regulator
MFDLHTVPPIENEPLSQVRDKVYTSLREAILDNRLKPGERLVERKLADQLKVSRTPVREAIRMLELEGLVSHLPRIGAVVARIDHAEVLEIYRIRAVLEGLAARMAAERITPDSLGRLEELMKSMEAGIRRGDPEGLERDHLAFNDGIYSAAGSPRLYAMITSLTDFIARSARIGYTRPGRAEEAAREHRRLLEALRLHDGDLSERIAREHIDSSRKAYFTETAGDQQ